MTLVLEAKSSTNARDASAAADQLKTYVALVGETERNPVGMLVTPFLSPTGRTRLKRRGIGYADLTGNMWVQSDRPALFIESQGLDRNPSPPSSRLQSLKGRGAAAAIRALLDFRPPSGVRDLAEKAGVPAPTLSRVIRLLTDEGLIERDRRGAVADSDWQGVLRRWTQDYAVLESNRSSKFLEPRGLQLLVAGLLGTDLPNTVTGTLALPDQVPQGPARLALIYTMQVPALVRSLGLKEVDSGVNVLVLEPFTSAVVGRSRTVRDLNAVALSQLAADLLTSPGRGPSEAEELIEWMERNQDDWRS